MPKTTTKQVVIDGVEIEIVQKRMKNMNLRIYPPQGRVRVAAPTRLSFKAIQAFIISKIVWIKAKQIEVKNRKIAPKLEFISGENYSFFGKKYLLEVLENQPKNAVKLEDEVIKICGKKTLNIKEREKLLDGFYRVELRKIIPQYIAIYQEKMLVNVAEFQIKKMKTRWGTCNSKVRRIWISLELAKRPIECLEFIIVHEMTHLLERKHNKRFYALMDKFLPSWRECEKQLRQLGHSIDG